MEAIVIKEPSVTINFILLWGVVLFNLLLTLAVIRRVSGTNIGQARQETLNPGEVAPRFQAPLLRGEDIVNQDTYKGRSLLFLVIGIDCQPCHDFLLHVSDIATLAKENDITPIIVSDSNRSLTNSLIEKFNINIPTIIADKSQNKFFEDYKVLGTPWYCLIDQNGVVRAAGFPGINAEDLRKKIEIKIMD